jgi:hypothetical protein
VKFDNGGCFGSRRFFCPPRFFAPHGSCPPRLSARNGILVLCNVQKLGLLAFTGQAILPVFSAPFDGQECPSYPKIQY